ncbi:Rep fac-A 3 and RAI16-like domain containing prot ein [Trichuris trichiura]|uniref:Rep fac-A 3 and RAI16-like domain containing prot ein n=1 Tax=Trichuris trichiura TaxID=36087 RepID=A0A077ZDT4_TRITR|nr:Rep fac-A 3 and RAI16-like domain containing prot ein [Trichuris trichiura]
MDSDWIDQPKTRVNSSMIKSGRFNGKLVTVLGQLGTVDEERRRFQIDLGDHVMLEARFSGMWSPFLGNIVEATGMLISSREMLCYSYCSFEPQLTAKFDMSHYNKAVSVFHEAVSDVSRRPPFLAKGLSMYWLKRAMNIGKVESSPEETVGGADAQACMDAFHSHWMQVKAILMSDHPTIESQTIVFRHLEQLITLIVAEVNEATGFRIGPMLELAFNESIFSMIVSWATDCRGQARLFALRNIFKIYEIVVSQTSPCIIVHKPILRPLLYVLDECDNGEEWLLNDIREPMVFLLHQVCTKIAQKEEWSMLEFFFDKETDHKAPRFLVFTLLVPFLYFGGRVEQLVRDALLLVLSVSSQLDAAGLFLANETNFCPVLASGLAAVYSSLPRRLYYADKFDDWCRVTPVDLERSPELLSFRNALEFCNAVAQASHHRVVSSLVKYIYNGFLLSVFKQALLESTVDDLHSVIAYLELIFRCLAEAPLQEALVRFMTIKNTNGMSVLESLVYRMGKHAKLTKVCLALFETLLDLNSEKVMFELIFRYIISCRHIVPGQIAWLKQLTLFDDAYDVFLALSPIGEPETNPNDQLVEEKEQHAGEDSYMDDDSSIMDTEVGAQADPTVVLFGYWKWARYKVEACRRACRAWNYPYDGSSPSPHLPEASSSQQGASFLFGAESARSAAETLSFRRSENQFGLNPNCLYRQSRTKAYYAKKKLDKTYPDNSQALSALDLAISGADTDLEGWHQMLNSDQDQSRLISFESETFLNLYCSTAVPSSFMQLTFVDNCASSREPDALDSREQTDTSVTESTAADWSAAVDAEKFEKMLLEVNYINDESPASVHDAVHYICYMYDKLLLSRTPSATMNDSESIESPKTHPVISRLELDESTLEDMNDIDLQEIVRDGDAPLLGPFLTLLFGMMERMTDNSLLENLLLTGLLARLACYPQVLIATLLLSTVPLFNATVRSLSQILASLSTQIQDSIRPLEHLPIRLQLAREMIEARQGHRLQRRRPDGSLPNSAEEDDGAKTKSQRNASYSRLGKEERAFLAGFGFNDAIGPLLQCAVILDEFCKEIAAIALEQSLQIRLPS